MSKEVNIKSIAVLPFVNMSGEPNSEFFADGITEEIINALTRIPELKVTSRTSSFFYKNKNIPIPKIGKDLWVSLILEGSIRFGGDKIRITAQLIHAIDDFHFWSETWDRSIDNIFEVQDEVSLMIAEKAREFLGHFELQDTLVRHQTDDFQAYEWFLKGRYHFRQWNPEDAKKAITFYDKALSIDPNHAESLLGKADAIGFLATTGFMPQSSWKQIKVLIDGALKINSHLAEGHYQLANYYFFSECNFQASLQSALKAKELNINHSETNQFLSFLYILANEQGESEKYLEHCLKVDPLSQETKFFEAYFYYMAGNYRHALKILDQILTDNNKNVPAHSVKAYCLLKLEKYEEALDYFNHVPSDVIVEDDRLGIAAIARILLKNHKKADYLVRSIETKAKTPEGFRADSFLLFIYAIQGNEEKVYNWIKTAIDNKSSLLLIQLNDPLVGSFRNKKKYQEYLKDIYVTDFIVKKEKKTTLLEQSDIEKYLEILSNCIQKEELYLNSDISLKSLASKIGLHPNKLSWLINYQYKQNFNQYINSYRIDHFKSLATNPDYKQYSILGLAYESGFNSKTVFNTYFKKEVGISPKAWIDNQ